MPLAKITPKMVLDRHAELTKDNGRAVADGTMRVLRAIYNNTVYLRTDDAFLQIPCEAEGKLAPAEAANRPRARRRAARILPGGDGAGLADRQGFNFIPALHRLPAAGGHDAEVGGR